MMMTIAVQSVSCPGSYECIVCDLSLSVDSICTLMTVHYWDLGFCLVFLVSRLLPGCWYECSQKCLETLVRRMND